MADWQAIRADYEQGISQRSLATKYGLSQAAISKKSAKEQWVIKPVITPSYPVISDNITIEELPDLSTVEKAIALIAERLDEKPENKDIKMLMDSLSQAYKIKMLLPTEQGQTETAYDMRKFLSHCTSEELAWLQPLITTVQERIDAEEQDKVQPIRKIG